MFNKETIKSVKKGFTLIEMVAVMALIGIILAMIGPNLKNALFGGKETGAKASLKAFKFAIESFHEDTGSYPKSLTELYEKPSDPKIAKLWKPASGYYLDQKSVEKLDPWKKEFQYELTKGGKNPYELWSSRGQDEDSEKVEDRISIWDI